jgi:undecaprenyl-phosphate galactose phosphotransferase
MQSAVLGRVSSKVQRNWSKRLFDLCFAAAALTIGAPLFLAIALLIKSTSRGPILYRQQRVGQRGRLFYCYKFRSMFRDADRRLHALLATDRQLRAEWRATFKLKSDPRITPIGKWLRRTSLDELPQFWNVLQGDLSVVGPRPVVPEEMRHYFGARTTKLLSVKPGLTGLWQVSGRNNTTYEERLALDERYVDTHNFWLDLKLIARTPFVMLCSRGAY